MKNIDELVKKYRKERPLATRGHQRRIASMGHDHHLVWILCRDGEEYV